MWRGRFKWGKGREWRAEDRVREEINNKSVCFINTVVSDLIVRSVSKASVYILHPLILLNGFFH